MKFLIAAPLLPPDPGGPSYYAVALEEALTKAGHQVDMLAFRDVRHLPSVIRHIVFFMRALRRVGEADVLLALDSVSVGPAVLAGKLRGRTTIVRIGGDFVWERYIERTHDKVLLSEFYPKEGADPLVHPLSLKERLFIWLERHLVLGLASCVVYNTRWQRSIWAEPYGIPEERTAVIENAYRPSDGTHEGGDTYLCAWRPTAFKNIETLEEAYKLAKEKCPDVKLEIFKAIPREELAEHMRTARALIIPSLSELGPNMAMEALAIGLPVLLTADAGVRDRFGDAVIWIDPKRPDELAKQLCRLLNDDEYALAKERAAGFSCIHTYDDIAAEFVALAKKHHS